MTLVAEGAAPDRMQPRALSERAFPWLDLSPEMSGADAPRYPSVDPMLSDAKPDLYCAFWPNVFHHDQIRLGLEAGGQDFTEKPVVVSIDETLDLSRDLAKHGGVNRAMVRLVLRSSQHMVDAMEAGIAAIALDQARTTGQVFHRRLGPTRQTRSPLMTRQALHIGPNIPAGGSPLAPRAAAMRKARHPIPLCANIPAGCVTVLIHAPRQDFPARHPIRLPIPSAEKGRGWRAMTEARE